MKPDTRIRVGDTVRVVTPTFFVRCGYDNTIDHHVSRIHNTPDDWKVVAGLLHHFGLSDGFGPSRSEDRIIREIAYACMRRDMRNGAERKLYTENHPPLAGQEFRVTEIRYVRTGTYDKGFYCGYDEDYGEPPSLMSPKTHIILSLASPDRFVFDLRIEACYVEKVIPPES